MTVRKADHAFDIEFILTMISFKNCSPILRIDLPFGINLFVAIPSISNSKRIFTVMDLIWIVFHDVFVDKIRCIMLIPCFLLDHDPIIDSVMPPAEQGCKAFEDEIV